MITLHNDALQAQIALKGAELQSLQLNGVEYLWQGDPASWKRQAPLLFPFVGRLKDNQYTYAGQRFEQTQHGFARDREFSVVDQSATTVTLRLEADEDTKAHYPFDFVFEVTYRLSGRRLAVETKVTNPSAEETLIYGYGAHPGFKVPLVAGEAFEDTRLSVAPAKDYNRIVLDGPHSDLVHLQKQDLKQPLALSHELFANDAMILATTGQPVTVSLTGKSQHGLQVIEDDAPYVAIWSPSPNYGDLVCVESWWGLADSTTSTGELENKAAMNRLAPGMTRTHSFVVELF